MSWQDDEWFPAYHEYCKQHDANEAIKLADWDTRHWWSDSDDHALNVLDPWLPPHLRLASESRKDGETPMNTPTFAPASSWVRKRRHLARVDQLQDDPKRPGRYGKAICNQDGGRVYDQDWITAELKKWGLPPLRLADLPLCKRCERTANRLGGVS